MQNPKTSKTPALTGIAHLLTSVGFDGVIDVGHYMTTPAVSYERVQNVFKAIHDGVIVPVRGSEKYYRLTERGWAMFYGLIPADPRTDKTYAIALVDAQQALEEVA